MKTKLLPFLILLGMPFMALSQKTRFNFDVALIFGETFNGDTITVISRGDTIVPFVILTSNTVGSANFSVSQKKNILTIKHDEKITTRKAIVLKPFVELDIIFRSEKYHYQFDLKKGKILYASNKFDGDRKQVFTVIQQNYPVYFF